MVPKRIFRICALNHYDRRLQLIKLKTGHQGSPGGRHKQLIVHSDSMRSVNPRLSTMGGESEAEKRKIPEMSSKLGFKECLGFHLPEVRERKDAEMGRKIFQVGKGAPRKHTRSKKNCMEMMNNPVYKQCTWAAAWGAEKKEWGGELVWKGH